jgi:hypothetical protein
MVSEGGQETMHFAQLKPLRHGDHPRSEGELTVIPSARWEPPISRYPLHSGAFPSMARDELTTGVGCEDPAE